jgi:uncharacterized cofD-like protein
MTGKTQNIVTIGGGSGHFELLSGLRDIPDIHVNAIVTMFDNGGSSGRLREEFDTLPPGDILKCMIALSPHRQAAKQVLLKRFTTNPRLSGHNAGNFLITMLSQYTDFPQSIAALSDLLEIKGTVLPVSTTPATLTAQLSDGTQIHGEYAIGNREQGMGKKITRLALTPHNNQKIIPFQASLEALRYAQYIILSPGDLYSSIIPNLIVPGVKEAVKQSHAQLIYVLNMMTRPGETHNFQAHDFIHQLEHYIGQPIDHILFNNQKPPADILEKYKRQNSEFVSLETADRFWQGYTLHAAPMLQINEGTVRHHAEKLAQALKKIISP